MCHAMVHRGPDDAGLTSVGEATLGMRRLAIFDPAHGRQPMVSRDGRFTLVFNGAIYNFRSLRDELTRLGHTFLTQCDTEVLLSAYAQWGEACLPKLRGMFAFAVWDAHENVLFLARDAFGIKPLYYRRDPAQGFLFASELNALLASGVFAAEIDPAAVRDYLGWLAVPAPRTIYRDLQSLRPGECAILRNGELTIRQHWSFNAASNRIVACETRPDFIHELRARLEDTIRAHLVADVPVGAFLSGGLDSAAIVGLMVRLSGTRLKTFSIGFAERDFSEAAAAAQNAHHFATDHHCFELSGEQLSGDLETIIEQLDQPTGDGLNTYYASRAARAGGVTVALSGLGGDELFGGYPSFGTTPRLASWLPWWWALPEWVQNGMIGRLRNGSTRRRKLADFLQHAENLPEVAALQRRVFDETTRHSLLSPDVRNATAETPAFHPELAALTRELGEAGSFDTVSAWELRTYMADVLLRDSDVMSMRHSLELRVPFVDRPLIEWLERQPAKFKRDRFQQKTALSDAVHDLLPIELMTRRKRGFTFPFPVWMKAALKPFLEETFSHVSVNRSGLFSREPVQMLWRNFLAGRDDRAWSRVWSLAVLIAFVNRSRSL
jgi:asparagine synthase (glutamine-hydrolysing)